MKVLRIVIPILILGLVGGAIYYFTQGTETKQAKDLLTSVKKGEFKIYVNATGELQAKRSIKIMGPQGMRTVQVYQTTISDLVPEGTIVNEGDYVASLDKTELSTKIKEAQTEIDRIMTQLDQAKIDTAIEMRAIRDNLINLKFSMEEKKLQVKQSQFEPQMVIRQAEIELEKADRDYAQLEQKLKLTKDKSEAKISEILTNLTKFQLKMNQLTEVGNEFNILAPADGMVIYSRSWDGTKVTEGAQIRAWDPVVAELPDLSDMISKTFVNEVDISKVQKGQDVKIKVDAFPDNEYTGQVIQVANIGEELRGYDAKVFEVIIQMVENDSILRPAMTTSNEILTYTFADVLHIPLEALQSDSLTFVYKQEEGNIVKQEIITSESNDNEIIIEYGLQENDRIYLSTPEGTENMKMNYIPAEIKSTYKRELTQAREKRMEEARAKAQSVKEESVRTESGGGGGMIIF